MIRLFKICAMRLLPRVMIEQVRQKVVNSCLQPPSTLATCFACKTCVAGVWHPPSGGIYKLRFYTNWMRNENHKNYFEKEITVQKTSSPRILMKLDFPVKGLSAGDEVLADFSMRSLSNLPIPFYEAYFTVMHQGEKINEGSLITDKEGKYLLKFKLPEVLKSSDALLNIKVNFDGFTESISRNIKYHPIATFSKHIYKTKGFQDIRRLVPVCELDLSGPILNSSSARRIKLNKLL